MLDCKKYSVCCIHSRRNISVRLLHMQLKTVTLQKWSCVAVRSDIFLEVNYSPERWWREYCGWCHFITKASIGAAMRTSLSLIQEAWLKEKYCIILLYLHNCGLLNAGGRERERGGSHRVISKLACCHLRRLLCHSEKQASVQTHEPSHIYCGNVN